MSGTKLALDQSGGSGYLELGLLSLNVMKEAYNLFMHNLNILSYINMYSVFTSEKNLVRIEYYLISLCL